MKSPRPIVEVLRVVRSDNPFEPLVVSKEYAEGWKAGALWARPDVVEAIHDEVRCIYSIRIDGPLGPCTLSGKRCPFVLYEQLNCDDYRPKGAE